MSHNNDDICKSQAEHLQSKVDNFKRGTSSLKKIGFFIYCKTVDGSYVSGWVIGPWVKDLCIPRVGYIFTEF